MPLAKTRPYFLFPKKVACNDVNFATPPFVDVIVESQGAPILLGNPSLQNRHAFVQADSRIYDRRARRVATLGRGAGRGRPLDREVQRVLFGGEEAEARPERE